MESTENDEFTVAPLRSSILPVLLCPPDDNDEDEVDDVVERVFSASSFSVITFMEKIRKRGTCRWWWWWWWWWWFIPQREQHQQLVSGSAETLRSLSIPGSSFFLTSKRGVERARANQYHTRPRPSRRLLVSLDDINSDYYCVRYTIQSSPFYLQCRSSSSSSSRVVSCRVREYKEKRSRD